jgi:hypothetical protein
MHLVVAALSLELLSSFDFESSFTEKYKLQFIL